MAHMSLPLPCLMLVTEPMERPKLVDVVQKAVAGGVNVIQLRNKAVSLDELTRTAAIVKVVVPGTPLLVNRYPEAARAADASGVHLPERGARIDVARRRVGSDRLIGCSVHSVKAAARAAGLGADYLIAGTIFESDSHPDVEPAGLDFLQEVCTAVSIPIVAIGGVTPENAPQCIAAGAAGVAVLSAILHATDPQAAAAQFWESLNTRRRA